MADEVETKEENPKAKRERKGEWRLLLKTTVNVAKENEDDGAESPKYDISPVEVLIDTKVTPQKQERELWKVAKEELTAEQIEGKTFVAAFTKSPVSPKVEKKIEVSW